MKTIKPCKLRGFIFCVRGTHPDIASLADPLFRKRERGQ